MKKILTYVFSVLLALFLVWACGKDDEPTTPPVAANNAPTIEAATFTVPENQTEIDEVSANDPDEDELSFSITENSNGLFNIDENTGALTVAEGKILDYEDEAFNGEVPVYTITVQVEDDEQATASTTMTINVTNVNEAPEFTNETFAFEVSEGVDENSVIEIFTAFDPDAGDELAFSVSVNDNELFAINAETGALGLAEGKSLNFDSAQQHTLTIQVTDKEQLSDTEEVTITVTEVDEENQSPTIKEGQNFPVAEDKPAGEVFGTVDAEDPEQDPLSFMIVEDASELFDINEETGELSLAEGKALDFEDEAFNGEAPVYTLTIRASDNNTFTDGEITITVTNVDEEEEEEQNSAPQITNETIEFDVAENTTDETVIVTVTADDPDEGDPLTFSITDNSGTFEINAETGEVSLIEGESLDYEGQVQQYEITVQVTDGAENNDQEDFTINVTNVNEVPVLNFEATDFNVPENIDADQVIGTLSPNQISDPEDDPITFTILGNTLFEINAQGEISLKPNEELDFENLGQGQNPIIITVRISDGENNVNEEVTITVTDVNEVPVLYFETTEFNAPENIDAEELIGKLDLDDIIDPEGDAITFTILGNTLFEINEIGQITLKPNEELDFESLEQGQNPIIITVQVSDGENNVNEEVTITVENVIETIAEDPSSFVTSWAAAANETITIGINNLLQYNFTVDWGDGVVENIILANSDSFEHTYTAAGTYIVAIQDDFPAIKMGDNPDNPSTSRLLSIDQWGTIEWERLTSAFESCDNMTYQAIDNPILTNVTVMNDMFKNASSFDGNIGEWDTSNVRNMNSMFAEADSFNGDISGWDTGEVRTMMWMFQGAGNFDQNLANWDISKVGTGNGDDMLNMLNWSGMSAVNYSLTLIGWAEQLPNLETDVELGATNIRYCDYMAVQTARQNLINHGWDISDNGSTNNNCN